MKSLTKRISITDKCNQNCIFCSRLFQQDGAPRSLGRKEIEKNLRNRSGCNRLNITGGEPTLSKDLLTYIAIARKEGYQQITLMTNGRKCCNKHFVQELKKNGLTDAVVSIQHLNEGVNRRITQDKDSLEEKMAGIKNLAASKVTITANILIFALNYDSLLKLTKNLHTEFSIKRFAFSFIEPNCDSVRGDPGLIPDIQKSLLFLKKAVNYCKKNTLRYYIPYDGSLPPCIYEKFKIRINEPETVIGSDFDETNHYFNFCNVCLQRRSCRGVSKEYFVNCLRILDGKNS